MKRTLTLLLLTSFGNVWAGPDTLRVIDPWIREAPPGHRMLAGYMALENDGEAATRLVGAESEVFADVSLHRTVLVDGISRMRAAGVLELAPGERLVLEPGGLHLMLMGPKDDLRAGDAVPIVLKFESGEDLSVTFEVKRPR